MRSIVQLLDAFDNDPMILMLLQSRHHNNSNHTLDADDTNWHSTTMDSIAPGISAQSVLLREGLLVALKLAVHIPGADSPAQDGLPLPRNPILIIGHDARVCDCVEENLVLVREGDAYDDGCCDREETRAKRRAEQPGILCCEVFES